jgi:hypothetical protein
MKLFVLRWICIAICFHAAIVHAEPNNPNTDWFRKAGYGVFVHYLEFIQNNPEMVQSLGKKTSWDACVREFDVNRFADAMAEAGAGYVIFTMHQRTQHLIAPNATFDRLTGYKPGEACATRDLVEDLYQALHRKGIPLMLYWTGNGPISDAKAAAALECHAPVTREGVEKWASVVAEYGNRYGDKVVGWWCDGCCLKHGNLNFDQEKLGILAQAMKAGNPKRIIALNPGVEIRAYSPHEDFTAGEQTQFHEQPAQRWLNGEQWHVLSFLGIGRLDNPLAVGWGQPGVGYSKRELAEYIFDVNQAGGVVSIDVLLFRDGSLDRSQLQVLKSLRPAMAAMKPNSPVPPGNLAFHKPAKLLNLAGTEELMPSAAGGDGAARFGVDGNANTAAQAANEWPWTYEVDLLDIVKLRRAKVTFRPNAYATQLRIQTSTDRKRWQTVTGANGLTGHPYTTTFRATAARYVRVIALRPNGPEQPGTQMSVAELELYE